MAHAIKTCGVSVYVGDGLRWACFRTRRVTTAEVAFNDFAGVLAVIHRAEWAGDRADLAAHANVCENVLGTRFRIDDDGVDRASVHAPCLGALSTGVGRKTAFFMESKDLDARFCRVEHPFAFE